MAAARIPLVLPRGSGKVTVRQVTDALVEAPDLMLDVVDAALHPREFFKWQLDSLDEILKLGRCEAQPMRSASETMIPSGPRT
jgi:hypothetical protein